MRLANGLATSSTDRLYWARRLEIVRTFARHRAATEPETEIPLRGLLGPAHRRPQPYLFTDAEVVRLMSAARRLKPAGGMRPHIYPALFGLLACSGLRISEALHLNRDEVDLTSGRLMIRETKFCKSRIVPLHPTAVLALNDLTHHRDRIVPKPQCDRF